jgi:hypothetical protein
MMVPRLEGTYCYEIAPAIDLEALERSLIWQLEVNSRREESSRFQDSTQTLLWDFWRYCIVRSALVKEKVNPCGVPLGEMKHLHSVASNHVGNLVVYLEVGLQ